ncbi:unnamed protein product [marine sediment metagenome]|uniref:Uncharacterized protein n=1 Tax=marine sediment metagenome TaxID=412755 RepID=X0SYT9_9ZZZZ
MVSAELLIFSGPHWMDALTPEQVAERVKKNPDFQDKYDNRSEVGDIIETAPAGRYGADGHNKKHFHITVKDMTYDEVRKYQRIQEREPTEQEVTDKVNYTFSKEMAKMIAFDKPVNEPFLKEKLTAFYSKELVPLKKQRYKLDVSMFPVLESKPRLIITKSEFLAALVDKN